MSVHRFKGPLRRKKKGSAIWGIGRSSMDKREKEIRLCHHDKGIRQPQAWLLQREEAAVQQILRLEESSDK